MAIREHKGADDLPHSPPSERAIEARGCGHSKLHNEFHQTSSFAALDGRAHIGHRASPIFNLKPLERFLLGHAYAAEFAGR